VSGSAPGSVAVTWIVGNSTWGSGETEQAQARIPLRARPLVSSVVATPPDEKARRMFMPTPVPAGKRRASDRRRDRITGVV